VAKDQITMAQPIIHGTMKKVHHVANVSLHYFLEIKFISSMELGKGESDLKLDIKLTLHRDINRYHEYQ
jgi:hypothetical protein